MCIGQWCDVWGRKRTCRSLKECSLASRAWGTSWKRSGWTRLYSSRSTFFSTGGSVGACCEAKARVPQAVCAFCSLRVVRAGTRPTLPDCTVLLRDFRGLQLAEPSILLHVRTFSHAQAANQTVMAAVTCRSHDVKAARSALSGCSCCCDLYKCSTYYGDWLPRRKLCTVLLPSVKACC